jgi:phytoene dehydrogenase-like protein
MHLHAGFDATGLEGMDMHALDVASWEGGVDAEHNVVLMSVPSVVDAALAPRGAHCLHAYYPATEPSTVWDGVERGSEAYEALKRERSARLFDAVEDFVPDFRARAAGRPLLVGTPLTHARYLNRAGGTYGPAWPAGRGLPGVRSPIPNLLTCGDFTFPGVGVPAVAASGMAAASTIAGVGKHWQLLGELGL